MRFKKPGVLKMGHVIGYNRCIKTEGSRFIGSDRERKGGCYEEKQDIIFDSSGTVRLMRRNSHDKRDMYTAEHMDASGTSRRAAGTVMSISAIRTDAPTRKRAGVITVRHISLRRLRIRARQERRAAAIRDVPQAPSGNMTPTAYMTTRMPRALRMICMYEEFYDYEDDYEDEDEAYDAAVDYWYDHH